MLHLNRVFQKMKGIQLDLAITATIYLRDMEKMENLKRRVVADVARNQNSALSLATLLKI